MKNFHATQYLLLVVIAFLTFGCSSKTELPNYGAFLKEASKVVEIDLSYGSFSLDKMSGIPNTNNTTPVILLWQQNTNLDYLILYDEVQERQIEFKTKPLDDGIIEIRFDTPLEQGIYCLRQGNPLKPMSDLPSWCFSIKGGLEEMIQSIEETQTANENNWATAIATIQAVEATQIQQTAEAQSAYEEFWSGPQGNVLASLAGDSLNALYKGFEKRDPSVWTPYFSPNTVVLGTGTYTFRTLQELMNCDGDFPANGSYYSGSLFQGEIERFDINPIDHNLEEYQGLYDPNHAGLKVRLNPSHEYETRCTDSDQVMEIEDEGGGDGEISEACFFYVKTKSGWLIERINFGRCDVYESERPHLPLPEEHAVNRPTPAPASTGVVLNQGISQTSSDYALLIMILDAGLTVDGSTRGTFPVTLSIPEGSDIILGSWCAASLNQLRLNEENLSYFIHLDGKEIDLGEEFGWWERPSGQGDSYCGWINGLASFPRAGIYRFQFTLRFFSEVDNGWLVFPPGDQTFDVTMEVY